MKNILVADNLELICTGLTALINHQATSFQVVDQVTNGTDAYMAVEQSDIDIVIMELDMPGENGQMTLQRLRDSFPDVRVIILSTYEEKDCIAQCFHNGAAAYLLKRSSNAEILNALEHVSNQETYVDPNIPLCHDDFQQLANACSCGCSGMNRCTAHYEQLSRREREVFPLITMGYANREIAERLCISTKTVEAHKASIMRKLSLTCHLDLVQYAVHHHMVNV